MSRFKETDKIPLTDATGIRFCGNGVVVIYENGQAVHLDSTEVEKIVIAIIENRMKGGINHDH